MPFVHVHDVYVQSAMPFTDSLLVVSVCRLLTALLGTSGHLNLSEGSIEQLASMNCAVAIAWGLGGHLPEALRMGLSKHLLQDLTGICTQLKCLHDSVTIYDIAADEKSLTFKTFASMVPQYEYETGIDFNNIFVPTAGTVGHKLLLDSIVRVRPQPDSTQCTIQPMHDGLLLQLHK